MRLVSARLLRHHRERLILAPVPHQRDQKASACLARVTVTGRIHRPHDRPPTPDSSHQYARRLNRWLRVAGEARPRWSELSDLPHEELARRISVFVANQERKTVLDVPTLHSLFKEAGFDRSTIATHNYRGREFALVEAHKGRV